jgi:lipopolysaccharide/colanic/teichoic acid biosynthesis glycosyltransferase/FlaA1/EpsC-like NDP-sugar epimerase
LQFTAKNADTTIMYQTKRFVDIILSLTGIIIMIPLLPIIALLIKMDSKGPVFYLTERVGKDMAKFKMYKFRTMVDSPIQVGQSVCPQYDPRVTFFGRFLRRTKLNEVPQLLNVIKGEMTLVGPRPEAPDLAELYPEKAKKVFSVKPGLVGPASIMGRNEEECYPPGVDAKQFYFENILPKKLKTDLEYIDNESLLKDLNYIYRGIKETITGAINKKHLNDNKSQIFLLYADFLLTLLSFFIVTLFYHGRIIDKLNLSEWILFLIIMIFIRISFYVYFGLYSSLIRYISYNAIRNVIFACAISSLFLSVVAEVIDFKGYSVFIALFDGLILTAFLSSMRLSLRYYWEKKRRINENPFRRRVLIYGADDFGYMAQNALVSNGFCTHVVVGFIDDNLNKCGKTVNGLKVLGNRYHIKELSKLYHIDEIYISHNNDNSDTLFEIAKICQAVNIKCRMMFFSNGYSKERKPQFSIRNMELSDILPLNSIHYRINDAKEAVTEKTILLNGSGGTVGIELSRKMILLGCKKLIIVEKYEAYLNESICALITHYKKELIIPVLIDNDDFQQLEKIFKKYCPDIVIQAAMRKYDSFLNTTHSFINKLNIVQTMNLSHMAVRHRSQLFVLISTLAEETKKISRVNVSVQTVENSLKKYFINKNTRLVISRLCDIAENRGSVVSIIENQIVNQGKVILPSLTAKCSLISKHSAAEFIIQSISEDKNNNKSTNIYKCDQGINIAIIELAKRIAIYHGLNPWTEVEIYSLNQSKRFNTVGKQRNVSSSLSSG